MIFKWLCSLYYKLRGWKIIINLPPELKKFIIVGAPHTSNQDFFLTMAVFYEAPFNPKFAIKDEWLNSWAGFILKSLGAIGINRKQKNQKTTDVLAQIFENYEELALTISPEGTRKAAPKWKTGFYYIAQKAQVPIVLAYVNYKNKVCHVEKIITPQHFEKDMKEIMAYYKDRAVGAIPHNFQLDPRFLKLPHQNGVNFNESPDL